MSFDALVLLGCRVADGVLPGAAARRVERAAAAYHAGLAPRIIVSGGRAWQGGIEADQLAGALEARGVPRHAMLLERASRTTRENARLSAALLASVGATRVGLVSCDWHLPRALACFRRVGVQAEPVAAPSPPVGAVRRAARSVRERGAAMIDSSGEPPMVTSRGRSPWVGLLVPVLAVACSRGQHGNPTAAASASHSGAKASAPPPAAAKRAHELLLAEQRRASADVTLDDLSHPDARVRQAAARALARIGDARAVELLSKSLADADPGVIAWSAFGLGAACRDRQVVTTRALSMRAASLALSTPNDAAGRAPPPRGALALLGPRAALADALGRCGGSDAEHALVAWLSGDRALREQAALALGTLAARTGRLDDATLVALLDAASRRDAPVPTALSAFTRLAELSAPVRARLAEVARPLLAAQGLARTLAIRALANADASAAPDLAGVLALSSAAPAERADAARGLGRLGPTGQKALAETLSKLLADADTTSATSLAGDGFGVLTAALDALEPPAAAAAPALSRLAELAPVDRAPIERRVVALRCRAAALLAGSASESKRLLACDPDAKGRSGRLALLDVLGRGKLTGSRLARYRVLSHVDDPLVRQRALSLLKQHPEVPDARELLRAALDRKAPGDVAVAGEVLESYPDRASTAGAERATDPAVVRSLSAALASFQKTPAIEVRAALVGAAGALGLLGAKSLLETDCRSEHPALRAAAERALGLLGDKGVRCVAAGPGSVPEEASHLIAGKVELVFATDAGRVSLVLDPTLAPVAATRLAELARSGFFDGVVVHRVVPGFVVQLGDPGGDGYGGAPRPPLRDEPAPAPFEAASVGIALGGEDSGSSQFFVTLGRTPHLDGAYALVGHAGLGWDRLTEGDRVEHVIVAEPTEP